MATHHTETKQTESAAKKQSQVESAGQDLELAEQVLEGPGLQQAMASPADTSPATIAQMQRLYGNRAVSSLLAGEAGLIQTKLRVGPVGDKYEQEADRVSEQVMRMPAPEEEEIQMKPLVQRQVDEEEIQMKPLVQRQVEEEEIQMKSSPSQGKDGFEADPEIESRLAGRQGSGQPLPEELRSDMERRFGADFSGVTVHTGGEAAQLNQDLKARAFTHGRDIYFGSGEYEPGSSAGKELLAHELTHVIQQTGRGTASLAEGDTSRGSEPESSDSANSTGPAIAAAGAGVVQRVNETELEEQLKKLKKPTPKNPSPPPSGGNDLSSIMARALQARRGAIEGDDLEEDEDDVSSDEWDDDVSQPTVNQGPPPPKDMPPPPPPRDLPPPLPQNVPPPPKDMPPPPPRLSKPVPPPRPPRPLQPLPEQDQSSQDDPYHDPNSSMSPLMTQRPPDQSSQEDDPYHDPNSPMSPLVTQRPPTIPQAPELPPSLSDTGPIKVGKVKEPGLMEKLARRFKKDKGPTPLDQSITPPPPKKEKSGPSLEGQLQESRLKKGMTAQTLPSNAGKWEQFKGWAGTKAYGAKTGLAGVGTSIKSKVVGGLSDAGNSIKTVAMGAKESPKSIPGFLKGGVLRANAWDQVSGKSAKEALAPGEEHLERSKQLLNWRQNRGKVALPGRAPGTGHKNDVDLRSLTNKPEDDTPSKEESLAEIVKLLRGQAPTQGQPKAQNVDDMKKQKSQLEEQIKALNDKIQEMEKV